MHTEKREDPLVELGYEIRDLNTKGIRAGAVGFFIFAILSAVIGFGIFYWMYPQGFKEEKAQKRILPEYPNPVIQSNMTAKTDIMDLRQHETKQLEAPIGWVDDAHTRLHIPIETAMRLIANRGMPKIVGGTSAAPTSVVAVQEAKPAAPAAGMRPAPAQAPAVTPTEPAAPTGPNALPTMKLPPDPIRKATGPKPILRPGAG